mmetsp:Transcript_17420/g.36790  ORF Transcript_17420/g.36790 Transcript_17420/m.36790 type:complete len:349 (-) Transcript_17420:860-1906(-)
MTMRIGFSAAYPLPSSTTSIPATSYSSTGLAHAVSPSEDSGGEIRTTISSAAVKSPPGSTTSILSTDPLLFSRTAFAAAREVPFPPASPFETPISTVGGLTYPPPPETTSILNNLPVSLNTGFPTAVDPPNSVPIVGGSGNITRGRRASGSFAIGGGGYPAPPSKIRIRPMDASSIAASNCVMESTGWDVSKREKRMAICLNASFCFRDAAVSGLFRTAAVEDFDDGDDATASRVVLAAPLPSTFEDIPLPTAVVVAAAIVFVVVSAAVVNATPAYLPTNESKRTFTSSPSLPSKSINPTSTLAANCPNCRNLSRSTSSFELLAGMACACVYQYRRHSSSNTRRKRER